jgi:monoamine oxidase
LVLLAALYLTFCSGTSWYDQANSETILEFLDFDYPPPENEPKKIYPWWCVMGGAQQLALNMAKRLENNNIQFGQKVIGINCTTANAAQILIQGQTKYQGEYAGIFNSTTLGAMQQMDLTNAGLNYGQKQAIRSLGYGASAKVGMKFKYPWWRTLFHINQGGLGHSDLPIRTTVYPSYNINDDLASPAVLLCSYEWSQDAQRIAHIDLQQSQT